MNGVFYIRNMSKTAQTPTPIPTPENQTMTFEIRAQGKKESYEVITLSSKYSQKEAENFLVTFAKANRRRGVSYVLKTIKATS